MPIMFHFLFSFLLLPFFPIDITTSAHALLPRKARSDNKLMCLPDEYEANGQPFWFNLPKPDSGLWPTTPLIDPASYETLWDLCAWFPEGKPSMGCVCFTYDEVLGQHECKQEYADPALWQVERFRDICMNACKCPLNMKGTQSDKPIVIDGVEQGGIIGGSFSDADSESVIEIGDDTSESGESQDSGFHPIGDWTQRYSNSGRPTRLADLNIFPKPPVCGQKCRKSDFKCSRGSRNCICKASQVRSGLWDIAGCVGVVASSLGGRDVGPACPCNMTYVSQGCCHAENGLVWEDPVHHLGALDLGALEQLE